MASIKLTGDTSGEITISAPAVAGTNTISLPAETGNLLTSKTSGVVIGVHRVATTSTVSTTNTSPTASGLQITITPSSVDSKFLMMTSGGNVFPNNSATEIHIHHYVSVGGATASAINNSNTKGLIRQTVSTEGKYMQSTTTLYDANTTSELVFEPYFHSSNSSSTAYFNQGSVEVSVVVMEIAG